jgi:uncharacterized protein with PQ loop repeat
MENEHFNFMVQLFFVGCWLFLTVLLIVQMIKVRRSGHSASAKLFTLIWGCGAAAALIHAYGMATELCWIELTYNGKPVYWWWYDLLIAVFVLGMTYINNDLIHNKQSYD